MSDDLLITPGSRKLEIKDSSGNIDAKIETDSSGNLQITNAGGDIAIGDTTSDIFVGDGTNNIDIVFEQDGEIRGTSGVTVTLGASGSNVRMASDLNLNSNDITNVGDLTVTGNLTVSGTTTTVNSTNTTISDPLIELGSGNTGTNTNDLGLILERGTTGDNIFIGWDESSDRVKFATTTGTGSSTGDLTLSLTNIQANAFYGSVIGSGASITSLNASNLASGTVPSARLSLSASDIPSLAASKITSGTFADARIPSLAGSKITSGTIDTARLPNPIHLSGGNAILKLQETDVTNSPTWWHVADGSNYSIRLNNTGAYPIQILTDSDNDAVTNIELNYTVDLGGNKLQFGNEATSYIQNQNKQSTDVWRFQTEDGYIDIGSENTSWAHLTTDRNSFYFAPKVTVQGDINPYLDSSHNLGTNTLRWANVYADTLYGDGSNITGITATDSTKLPLSGGTMTGSIAMANYNITGVNQLEFNDPGEGIVFKSGSSGDMVLKIIDDSSDNILQYSGTSAVFDVQGNITLTGDVSGADQIKTARTNTASSGNDYDAINIGYIGSWSQNTNTIAGVNVTDNTNSGNYTNTVGRFGIGFAGSGYFAVNGLYSGGYDATGDVFRVDPNTALFSVNVNTSSGHGYYINGTQVIDSSRNLTNIGTISSGAITSTGNSRFNGDFQIGDTLNQNAYGILQVNQTSNVDEEGIGILSSGGGRSMRLWVDETNSYINSGNGGSGNLIFNEAITVSSAGNLTGVGTISSGVITATQLNINSGTTNTCAVFDSSDDKAFIIIRDDNTDAYLITKDGSFSIGDSSSDYNNFKVNITSGNTTIAGTVTSGNITSTGIITAGSGSGGVSLTHNDGEGNANVTFNHKNGVPEQNGQSARITVNTDGTSTEAVMAFEVSSADVTSGTALGLPVGAKIAHDYVEIPHILRHAGDTDTYIAFNGDRIRLFAGGVNKLDTNNTYLTGITSSQVTTALGYTPYQESTALSATTGAFSGNVDISGNLSVTGSGGITTTDHIKATGNNLKLHAGGTHVLNLDLNGKIYPQTDAAYDLGFNSSTARFRHAYLTGTLNVGSVNATSTGHFRGNYSTSNNALNILSTTNGSGVGITFSDNGSPPVSSSGQRGFFQYYHSDSASYGSGNAFIFDDTENNLSVVVDGKVLAKDGYYMKPSSGTGAGTQVINSSGNWVGGGNISQFTNNSGYLTSSSLSGYATESYVTTQVNNLIDSAPGALNTLNELAAAIGDDANFSTTITNSIATKMPKSGGTFTGAITSTAAGNAITISSEAPQIRLNDTTSGADDFWIHVNSDRFYILADRGDDGAWETPYPLELNASSNIGYIFGQRAFTEAYHPNADKLTTARTIAGTSFDGTANIDISYDNLTNKPSNISNSDTVDGLHASSFLRSDATDTASGTLSLNGRVNIGNSVTRPAALNSDSVAQARIGGSDVYLYVASLNSTGGYKVAVQAARASDFASFTLNLQSNGGALQRAGNTVWDAGNDGSGSGLDADLLDGQHGSHYLNYNNFTNTPTIPTNNNQLTNGAGYTTYSSNQATNTNSGVSFDSVITGNNGNGTNVRIGDDVWLGDVNVANTMSVRGNQNAANGFIIFGNANTTALGRTGSGALTYGGNTVWHAGNDGSGSGLDADTLDGLHASSLARTSATANINMNNFTISNLNNLTFNDPGASEGIKWNGGSLWQIYESGDALTNSSGNLQFTSGSGNGTRRVTFDTSGNLNVVSGDYRMADKSVLSENNGALQVGDVSGNDEITTMDIKVYAGNGRIYLTDGEIFFNGTSNSTAGFKMIQNTGAFHSNGDVIAYSSTLTASDERLKENIQPIEDGLNKVLKLKGVKYDWKNKEKGTNQIGLIAQEVEKVVPEVVNTIEDSLGDMEDMKVVNYSALVPVLVEALKEQQEQINELKKLLEEKKWL